LEGWNGGRLFGVNESDQRHGGVIHHSTHDKYSGEMGDENCEGFRERGEERIG
jgi:hypothetical protein